MLLHPAALAVSAGTPAHWLTGLLHGFDQWWGLRLKSAERGHRPFSQASFRVGILTPLAACPVLKKAA